MVGVLLAEALIAAPTQALAPIRRNAAMSSGEIIAAAQPACATPITE